MPETNQTTPNPGLTIELVSTLRTKQWFQESVAVLFNPSSGNTFEVDPATAQLIEKLKGRNLTVSEAMSVSGIEYPELNRQDKETRFRKEYLEPLHQLDLIHLHAS